MSGYALAVAPRHDRVDYSMAKGGLRLWIVIFVFFMLVSGMITVFSSEKEFADVAMDLDGDGEVDDVNEDVDEDALHSETKFEQEKIDKSSPSRTATDKMGLTTDGAKPRRRKKGGEADDRDALEKKSESHEEDEESVRLKKLTEKIAEEASETTDEEVEEVHEKKPATHEEKTKEPVEKEEETVQEAADLKEEAKEEKEEADSAEAPVDTPKPKVKVFRSKGKTKEEMEQMHQRKLEHQPVPEEADEKEREEDKREHVEEAPLEEQEPKAETISKPKVPVKVFRTKGKKKDEIAEKDESASAQEEQTCENGLDCTKPKERLPVRYTKLKGKTQEEILEDKRKRLEEQKDTEEKVPSIPVKVIRTKGRDKKSDTSLKQEEDHSGTVPKSRSDCAKKPKGSLDYKKRSISNREDSKIRQILDDADKLLDDHKYQEGLAAFEKILKNNRNSPRAHFGRARALEFISSQKQSNAHLEDCIRGYEAVLNLPNVPDDLTREVTKRLVERAQFRGWLSKAESAQRRLVDKFPDDVQALNELGVIYLLMGRNDDARQVFHTVLVRDPSNGFAASHYGFILKTIDDKLEESAEYLIRGIGSDIEEAQHSRFYYHLGDALMRLNRTDEAYDWYEQGAQKGIFLSKYQRSLYNVEGLTARPFWTMEQTTYQKHLRYIETEWKTIRDEGLAILDQRSSSFVPEEEKLTQYGDWKQFTLYSKGRKHADNCKKAPKTCEIVSKFPEAVSCKRGQIKFSVLHGGTHVWPHSGPTNCRLRGHLGLVVPPEPRLRVGNETRGWRKGKFLIIDDSFEHEVWFEGTGFRLILIVDFWHPELSEHQRNVLTPI